MDYVKPADVAVAMLEAGTRKLTLPSADLVIRGALSGAILGVGVSEPTGVAARIIAVAEAKTTGYAALG